MLSEDVRWVRPPSPIEITARKVLWSGCTEIGKRIWKLTTLGDQIARNSVSGFLRSAVAVPILFFLTPFVLHRLGNDRFAIWVLLNVITGYGQLTDFGVAKAIVYFVPQMRADGTAGISSLVSSAINLYGLTVSLAIILILVSRSLILRVVFRVPEELYAEGAFVVTWAVVIVGLAMITGAFNSVIYGYQRVDIATLIMLGFVVLDSAAQYAAVRFGFGLRGLVIGRLVTTAILLLATYSGARTIVPRIRYNPLLGNARGLRRMLQYGLNSEVASIMQIANDSISKVLLPALVSLTAITFFDLAQRVTNQIKNAFSGSLLSIFPAAAELHAREDIVRLRSLYYRSSRYLLLVASPVLVLAGVTATPLVRVWLGEGYLLTASALRLLSFAVLSGLIAVPPYEIVLGIGKAKTIAAISAIVALTNLLLSWILGGLYGYSGVVVGVCASQGILLASSVWACNRYIGSSVLGALKGGMLSALVSAVVPGYFVSLVLQAVHSWGDLTKLAVAVPLYGLLYSLAVVLTKAVDKEDLALAGRFLPLGLRRFSRDV